MLKNTAHGDKPAVVEEKKKLVSMVAPKAPHKRRHTLLSISTFICSSPPFDYFFSLVQNASLRLFRLMMAMQLCRVTLALKSDLPCFHITLQHPDIVKILYLIQRLRC